jgi:AAA family ATP:ADP antiporter
MLTAEGAMVSSSTTTLSASTSNIVQDDNRKRNKTIKKLVPLGMMFFCILFNYTILRDTKDVLVVTSAGAEIIPFLKTYVQLPGAILFTILYSIMSNKMSQAQVFYAVLVPFLAFFASFAGIIYPNRAFLHPHAAADALQALLPAFFTPLVSIFRNWTFSLFYCLAELWGSIVVSVLFWGFANDVTTVDEASRFYPLFGLGANVALIFSGRYVNIVSKLRASLPPSGITITTITTTTTNIEH